MKNHNISYPSNYLEKSQKYLASKQQIKAVKYYVAGAKDLLRTDSLSNLTKNNKLFKKLFITFQKSKNYEVIEYLSYYPKLISRHQKDALKGYLIQKYNNWANIQTDQAFLERLNVPYSSKYLNLEGLKQSFNSLKNILKGLEKNPLKIIGILDSYQKFIYKSQNNKFLKGQNTKKSINKYLIQIQNLYNKYKPMAIANMKVHREELSIPNIIIKSFKNEFTNNPRRIIKMTLGCSIKYGVFRTIFNHNEFDWRDIFSVEKLTDVGVEIENESDKLSTVDNFILKIIEKVKKDVGQTNNNNSKTELKYLQYYFDDFSKLSIKIFTLSDIKTLYNAVNRLIQEDPYSPFKLIPFTGKIEIAHITQLFPIIENKIRQLGQIEDIFPEKEIDEQKIRFKDPSTILTQTILNNFHNSNYILSKVETDLFIYFSLYDRNSLNIRNECIHCRDYFKGDSLEFGTKLTLFCLILIFYRIKEVKTTIENGAS